MKSKTSWQIKMNKPEQFELLTGPENWNAKYGGSTMVIPTPRLIEELLFEIPKGKVLTGSQMREHLAERCKADYACPLTTGIFLRICSEYAEELRSSGNKKIPPYWRIVRDDGSMNEKFPGGIESHKKLLQQEGHKFILKGLRKKIEVVVL